LLKRCFFQAAVAEFIGMRGDTDGPEAEDWFLKAEAFDSAWASTYDVDGLFYGGPRDVTQQEEHGLGNGQSSSFESSALLQPQARETQDGAAPAERPAADADVAAAPPALSNEAATTPESGSDLECEAPPGLERAPSTSAGATPPAAEGPATPLPPSADLARTPPGASATLAPGPVPLKATLKAFSLNSWDPVSSSDSEPDEDVALEEQAVVAAPLAPAVTGAVPEPLVVAPVADDPDLTSTRPRLETGIATWDVPSSLESDPVEITKTPEPPLAHTASTPDGYTEIPDVPMEVEMQFHQPSPVIRAGTEEWFRQMLADTEAIRSFAGRALSDFKTAHLVLGNSSECLALELLDIPYHCVGAVERQLNLLNFAKAHHSDHFTALWTTGDEFLANEGFCRIRGACVKAKPTQPHCASTRLPIPRASPSGTMFGTATNSTGMALEQIKIWYQYLETTKPLSWWVEFPGECKTAHDDYGANVFDKWVCQCKALDYSIIHFSVPHALWVEEANRTSLIVCAFSKSLGGSMATAWLRRSIEPVLRAQRDRGPIPIWRTVSRVSDGTVRRGLLEPDVSADELTDESLAHYMWFRFCCTKP